MDKLVSRIDTVFLPVADAARSRQWYEEKLGLQFRFEEAGYTAMDITAESETALTFMETEKVTPLNEPYNFFTSDVHRLYEHLLECSVETEPITTEGTFSYFTFKDPDGHTIGVCSFKED